MSNRAFDQFLRDVYGLEIEPEPERARDREILPPRAPRVDPKVDFAFAVIRFAGNEVKIDPR